MSEINNFDFYMFCDTSRTFRIVYTPLSRGQMNISVTFSDGRTGTWSHEVIRSEIDTTQNRSITGFSTVGQFDPTITASVTMTFTPTGGTAETQTQSKACYNRVKTVQFSAQKLFFALGGASTLAPVMTAENASYSPSNGTYTISSSNSDVISVVGSRISYDSLGKTKLTITAADPQADDVIVSKNAVVMPGTSFPVLPSAPSRLDCDLMWKILQGIYYLDDGTQIDKDDFLEFAGYATNIFKIRQLSRDAATALTELGSSATIQSFNEKNQSKQWKMVVQSWITALNALNA